MKVFTSKQAVNMKYHNDVADTTTTGLIKLFKGNVLC